MTRIFTLFLMFCIGASSYAQELTITNGQKTKNFDFNNSFNFRLQDSLHTDQGLGYYEFFGTVSEVSKDSVSVNLTEYHSHFDRDLKLKWNNLQTLPFPTEFKFAVDDLYYMQNLKSPKTIKRKRTLFGFGTAFIITGLMTTANTLLVKDKQSRKTILWSGVIQVGAGITLTSIGSYRKYWFPKSQMPGPWSVKH